MSAALIALVWYALWAVFLSFIVLVWRVREVMSGKTASNAFPSGEKHGSDPYWRANRAQINTLENLPIFAALALAGVAAGLDTAMFGTLAIVVVIARMAQSIIHLSSGSVTAVNFRFTAFLIQLVVLGWMGIMVLLHFYSM